MDIVKEGEKQRLAALERVAGSPPVDHADLRGELAAVTMLLTSLGALLAAVLGVLWLLS